MVKDLASPAKDLANFGGFEIRDDCLEPHVF